LACLVFNSACFNTLLTIIFAYVTMTNDQLKITIGDPRNAEALTTLGITTFLQAFAADNKKEDMDKYIAEEMNLSRITDELTDKDNLFFLAWYGDFIVGYAKLRTIKKPKELENNNPIELERIYVLQDYYNHKIGAALMDRCIAHALNHHHDVIWLGVWEQNHRAVSFYKRWGFEFFGSHIFKLGDDIQTDVLMKKLL
jgi:diamine N-acetyltransferase